MIRWIKKMIRRRKHYPEAWDAFSATCACGYDSPYDPFLSAHFYRVENHA